MIIYHKFDTICTIINKENTVPRDVDKTGVECTICKTIYPNDKFGAIGARNMAKECEKLGNPPQLVRDDEGKEVFIHCVGWCKIIETEVKLIPKRSTNSNFIHERYYTVVDKKGFKYEFSQKCIIGYLEKQYEKR